MILESIIPKSESHWLELRAQDVTSTEVSALFGISPYTTLFETWHRHQENLVSNFEETERSKWGTRLQDSIANGIAEDEGWKIRRMPEYIRHPGLRMGSSFDFSIEEAGILEIKNVDGFVFRDGWIVDGDNFEAPPHIEMQLQHQLAVSGRSYAYIGALIGGNRIVLIKREPDEQIISSIKKQVERFWNSIADNKEPQPDFARDADVIKRLYNQAAPGKIFDARGDQEINAYVAEYRQINESKKKLEHEIDRIKSQLIVRIGDCEKAVGDTFSISASMVKPTKIEYEREGYRLFRLNFRKEAKK
jgi:putative phage-type endonuclease